MTKEHAQPTTHHRLPWVLLVFFFVPAALSAHPTAEGSDELNPTLEESPFADFEPLSGFEERSGEPLELEDSAHDTEGMPEKAVALRFQFDRTMTYEVRNALRLHYDHRPDFAPVYQSGLFVEYYPIDEDYRDELARWPVDIDSEDTAVDGALLRLRIGNAVGSFDAPEALTDDTDVHPLLRDAVLSFRISDRGHIGDVQVHPPTNPLSRSSIEEMIRLLSASYPPLPEQDVSPGDSWENTVEWSVGDDDAELEHSAKFTYTFEKWTPCESGHCAVIDIEQVIDASGTYFSGTLQTDGVSSGESLGKVVFDVDAGLVVGAQWNLDARGATMTTRTEKPDSEPINDFGFGLNVDTTVSLY